MIYECLCCEKKPEPAGPAGNQGRGLAGAEGYGSGALWYGVPVPAGDTQRTGPDFCGVRKKSVMVPDRFLPGTATACYDTVVTARALP
jgi:hypothetical protein